jgi:hypothetical protein
MYLSIFTFHETFNFMWPQPIHKQIPHTWSRHLKVYFWKVSTGILFCLEQSNICHETFNFMWPQPLHKQIPYTSPRHCQQHHLKVYFKNVSILFCGEQSITFHETFNFMWPQPFHKQIPHTLAQTLSVTPSEQFIFRAVVHWVSNSQKCK